MDTQQVALMAQVFQPRNFSIIYNGGFAMTDRFECSQFLLESNSNVNIVEAPTLETAYVNACEQYVYGYWQRDPYHTPAIPTFEAVLKMPYHEPGFIPNVPYERYFATVHKDFVGIYDNVIGAMEFLDYFAPSELKEFSTVKEATLWLNEIFVLPILPMSAYITDKIPYIKNLPLNQAVSVNYYDWLNQHYQPQDKLSFNKSGIFSRLVQSNE